MEKKLKKCMDYVTEILLESGHDLGQHHPFRSRIRHIRRVLRWAERLCEGRNDVNLDILYTAVIFHDIGYADEDMDKHARASELMFRVYANQEHYDEEFTEKVATCIAQHSDKELLEHPEALMLEQILLMEADLLDEEGALAICWDGMACGYEGKLSYDMALRRTREEFAIKKNQHPMVTEKAKKLWEEKMSFVQDYIERLENDLSESRLV